MAPVAAAVIVSSPTTLATASIAAAKVQSPEAAITSNATTTASMQFIGTDAAVAATASSPTGQSGADAAGMIALKAAASGAVLLPSGAALNIGGPAYQTSVSDIGGSISNLQFTGSTHGITAFASDSGNQVFGRS